MIRVGCYHKGTFQMFWIRCAVFRVNNNVYEFFHYDAYYTELGGGPFRRISGKDFTFIVSGR